MINIVGEWVEPKTEEKETKTVSNQSPIIDRLGFALEVGMKVRLRNGLKARVVALDRKSDDCPVCVLYESSGNRKEYAIYLTADGKVSARGGDPDFDIVAQWKDPITVEGWVNVYPSGNVNFHSTKEAADGMVHSDRIACIKVTGTEDH